MKEEMIKAFEYVHGRPYKSATTVQRMQFLQAWNMALQAAYSAMPTGASVLPTGDVAGVAAANAQHNAIRACKKVLQDSQISFDEAGLAP